VLFGVLPGKKRVTFSVNGTSTEPINIDTGYHPDHLHEDEIQTFTFTTSKVLHRDCLERVLATLSDEYYRVKGFVRLSGVQGVWLVNYVCGRYSIEPFGDSPAQNAKIKTELACIGKKIVRYKKKVQDRFMKCEGVT